MLVMKQDLSCQVTGRHSLVLLKVTTFTYESNAHDSYANYLKTLFQAMKLWGSLSSGHEAF